MQKTSKITVFLLCAFVGILFTNPLYAQEASEENSESQIDGESAYLLGNAPIRIELGFLFGIPIHWWGGLAAEGLTGDDPDLGDDMNDAIGFLALAGYSAMSLLSGMQLGLEGLVLAPILVSPPDDNGVSTEMSAGLAVGNNFSLGSLINLSIHATGRYGTLGINDEGESTYGYIQPFLGYGLIARDMAGFMEYSHKELGNAAAVDDDYIEAGIDPPPDPEAGHYFDIGCRLSFNGGAIYALQYSHPLGEYGVPHIKFTMGGTLMDWGL
ncbi:MAG: hypothetical protein ACLFR1_10720 [Spirochaetia bacterium]